MQALTSVATSSPFLFPFDKKKKGGRLTSVFNTKQPKQRSPESIIQIRFIHCRSTQHKHHCNKASKQQKLISVSDSGTTTKFCINKQL